MKVIIEETISQEFDVEIPEDVTNKYDYVRELYKSGELVVENPGLVDAKFAIEDDYDQGDNSWVDMHP
jgi:hypothetical protein